MFGGGGSVLPRGKLRAMFTSEDETLHEAGRSARLYSATPSLRDRVVQLFYFVAYRAMRVYWRVRHPSTKGALVAIWSRGQVLLVRNSYLRYYSAPGGYVRPQENAREAALRELLEEVGMSARAEDLELALDVTHEWEGKRDHVQIFNLKVDERPVLRIDHREVVEAAWFAPGDVLGLDVFPPLKRAIASAM
jgi:ADP-ribose pyrophosphatase YjhB (NUDIX family)